MLVLACILLTLGLLYAWLSGHWFARVIVFIVLAPLVGLLVGNQTAGPHADMTGGLVGFGIGICLAWFLASIPIYYRRSGFRKRGFNPIGPQIEPRVPDA
jgi:hypothetical protein